jgi:hypothetical protein
MHRDPPHAGKRLERRSHPRPRSRYPQGTGIHLRRHQPSSTTPGRTGACHCTTRRPLASSRPRRRHRPDGLHPARTTDRRRGSNPRRSGRHDARPMDSHQRTMKITAVATERQSSRCLLHRISGSSASPSRRSWGTPTRPRLASPRRPHSRARTAPPRTSRPRQRRHNRGRRTPFSDELTAAAPPPRAARNDQSARPRPMYANRKRR